MCVDWGHRCNKTHHPTHARNGEYETRQVRNGNYHGEGHCGKRHTHRRLTWRLVRPPREPTRLVKNSLAEVGFATLANCRWAMMHCANLPMMDRYHLAHEAFQCAAHLDGLTVIDMEGITKTCYEHFVGQNPMFTKHLRTWGKAGTVKIKTSTSPKLNDKGTHCMFIGYTYNHPGDCYRMYDPKTGRT